MGQWESIQIAFTFLVKCLLCFSFPSLLLFLCRNMLLIYLYFFGAYEFQCHLTGLVFCRDFEFFFFARTNFANGHYSPAVVPRNGCLPCCTGVPAVREGHLQLLLPPPLPFPLQLY